MMKIKSSCPKCEKHIPLTYMKQSCPHCGANLLYYKMDERLENDAKKAQAEVDKVNHFVDILRNSTIKTPWHIVRLVLFFTPLASMCLPLFWAGHKNVSLITFIMSIVNHGFDFGAICSEKSYLFAILSMVLIIVLSLAEIINSLFTATKNGFKRNIAFSFVNTVVFGVMALLCCLNGGVLKIGYFVTLLILLLELVLHFVVEKKKDTKAIIACVLAIAICVTPSFFSHKEQVKICYAGDEANLRVVSFNVAAAFGTKLEDTDSADRFVRFVDYMNSVDADLIGTQELNAFWCDFIRIRGGYDGYAVARGGDSEIKNSEMNGIFWREDVFDMVDTGTFWLSETPDIESKYTYIDSEGNQQEAGCNRICSYAVLTEKASGKLVLFMNTHLDNSSEEARTFGVNLILDKMEELKAKYNNPLVILTGDFNETEGDLAVATVKEKLNLATDFDEPKATYQEWGYRQTGNEPIDFIFTSGDRDICAILDDISNGYVSDHYGIMADIIVE